VRVPSKDEVVEPVKEVDLRAAGSRATLVVETRRALIISLMESHPHTSVEELVRRARGAEEYILGP